MKLKEVFYGLGLKPRTREYSYEIESLSLSKDGLVQIASWEHPKARPWNLTQAAVDALRGFLKPGDVAIDIGAHTGDTTVPMALAVGPTGMVFALEPNRYVFKVLLANSALNRKQTNIYPLNFAATPVDGNLEFQYSDPGFCNGGLHEGISSWQHSHFFKLSVVGRNLYDFLQAEFQAELSRIRYIKIDTEGFDRSVATSLRKLLITNRPFLRSEIYKHLSAELRVGYYDELREIGYTIHKFNGPEDYCGQRLGRHDMARWPHFDVFAVPE
ncbi:MAG: FkbM family methyltransferase [Verrucomicrobia bacterium]|nr:FkbM family methyltransferase [Verrucomicrobiota bacterium]